MDAGKPRLRCAGGVRPNVDERASGSHFWPMKQVGLKALKNKLSEYVRAAAAGETVVITDRGRVVAKLVSPEPPRNESVIERGVREGWIRPAVRGPNWPPPRHPIPGLTLEQLLKELDEDREDRW